MVCATADATPVHATQSGRLRVAGIISATATITCLLTVDVQLAIGATDDIELHRTQTEADGFYDGNFVCTGHTLGVNTEGAETITYNLASTGAVSFKTAAD